MDNICSPSEPEEVEGGGVCVCVCCGVVGGEQRATSVLKAAGRQLSSDHKELCMTNTEAKSRTQRSCDVQEWDMGYEVKG